MSGTGPITPWRAAERGLNKLNHPLIRVQNRALEIHRDLGIQLKIGVKILTGVKSNEIFAQDLSSPDLFRAVQQKWGNVEDLLKVLSGVDAGVQSFNNVFGERLKTAGYKLNAMDLVLEVPESSKKGSWRPSILYSAIGAVAADLFLNDIPLTYGGNPLYEADNLRQAINERNADRIFTTLLTLSSMTNKSQIQSKEPVPIEQFFPDEG